MKNKFKKIQPRDTSFLHVNGNMPIFLFSLTPDEVFFNPLVPGVSYMIHLVYKGVTFLTEFILTFFPMFLFINAFIEMFCGYRLLSILRAQS